MGEEIVADLVLDLARRVEDELSRVEAQQAAAPRRARTGSSSAGPPPPAPTFPSMTPSIAQPTASGSMLNDAT